MSTTPTPRTGFTRFLPHIARVIYGLAFFVFGLAGFIHFMPEPKDMPEGAVAFMTAMMKTGYLFQLVKGTEVVVGALLLINRFVPLALTLIAPVLVNIFFVNLLLAPSGLPIAIIFALFEIYLAWSYRHAFAPMLQPKTEPA